MFALALAVSAFQETKQLRGLIEGARHKVLNDGLTVARRSLWTSLQSQLFRTGCS